MRAEPRRVTNTEAWTQWENQVVNGVFPLRRYLGGSNHGAVFLTEYKAKDLPDAAIKIVPADALQAEAQLVQWAAAARLSHPHLIRLFEVGRCQVEGREFLFVVMEYAEQTLAQILARRALSPDEVRELLLPTLDALAFLHRNHLVHGQLKPSNFLAVDDQLKLAGDTVRPAGNSASGIARTSAYDPPELKDRGFSTAGDIWGLGMTLVEALTQRTTAWPEEQRETASLPASFPASFVDTVRRCLSHTPAARPTVIELEAQYKPAPQAHSISDPQPPVREAPREVTAQQSSPKRHLLLPAIAAALLISLAVWVGWHFSGTSQDQLPPPAVPAASPAAPSAIAKSNSGLSSPASRPPDQPSLAPATSSPAVLHEVKPDVPRAIREKIQGRVRVTVRVLVDPAGNVVGKLMENPGPSRYFARLADKAAGEWKFAPTDKQGARVWLVRFAFSRGGVDAVAIAQ